MSPDSFVRDVVLRTRIYFHHVYAMNISRRCRLITTRVPSKRVREINRRDRECYREAASWESLDIRDRFAFLAYRNLLL